LFASRFSNLLSSDARCCHLTRPLCHRVPCWSPNYCIFGRALDFLAQLYMVAKSSQEETGKEAGEGVEIVKNIPYSVDDPVNRHSMEKGQYT
jgi:hypothetical protein